MPQPLQPPVLAFQSAPPDHAPALTTDPPLLSALFLDPRETPVSTAPPLVSGLEDWLGRPLDLSVFPPLLDSFRHGGWAAQRARTYAVLCAALGYGRYHTLERFASCGSGYWLLRDRKNPDSYRLALNCCHSRWCVPCQVARGSVIARNVAAATQNTTVRLLTLTLRASSAPLAETFDRLIRSFRKLRSLPTWKQHVAGALAFFEITRGQRTDHWHVHVHLLAHGKYWPRCELENTWERVTGDSRICDIRLVTSTRGVAYYVAKYTSKPIAPGRDATAPDVLEAVRALHGRKLCFATGAWRSLRLTIDPDPKTWQLVNFVNQYFLACLATSDDPYDLRLATAIKAALASDGSPCFSVPPATGPPPLPRSETS